jgi:hypothetical protein
MVDSIVSIAMVADAVLAVWVAFLVLRQMRPIQQLERLSLTQEESPSTSTT